MAFLLLIENVLLRVSRKETSCSPKSSTPLLSNTRCEEGVFYSSPLIPLSLVHLLSLIIYILKYGIICSSVGDNAVPNKCSQIYIIAVAKDPNCS